MRLTTEEQAMLRGEAGPAIRRAMEIVVALGQIYDADELVAVSHAQVAGVSYKNLGQAGLEFLQQWAAEGARVRVPTTLNPAGMDLAQWRELGVSAEFAEQQGRVIDAYLAMGIEPTLTCAPYEVGHRPRRNEHLAWSESSAVSFANSLLGARTNREGGPSALAAAITGRTPRYGLHLDEARRATHLVEVRCSLEDAADFGALGYLVGRRVRNGVPYFRLLGHTPDLSLGPGSAGEELLRALGAALAASGAVALYHVEGVTPEAGEPDILPAAAERVTFTRLDEGYAALNAPVEDIDLVTIGCPHASLAQIAEIARQVAGATLRAALWVTTARAIRDQAAALGYVAAIEAAGGRVVADTCMVVAPVEELGIHALATNSAKAAFYAPSHGGVSARFGSLEQCLAAARTGRWAT